MINTICNTTFLFITYLILLQILSGNPKSNNTKCLILPTRYIKNPSILANQIRNDFGPVGLLHEIL